MGLRSTLTNFDNDNCSKSKICLGFVASATLAYVGYVTIGDYLRRRRLLALIAVKRRERDDSVTKLRLFLQKGIPLSENVSNERESIVRMGFEDLRNRLQEGKLTAVEVLEAFQWRALEAHKQTNCACHFLEEARGWAEQLDKRYGAGSNEKKPPLFGIPFSNKECNHIAGHDSTIGCPQFIGQPVQKDCEMVTVLKQLGAVPFVLTNIPQTMMSVGCSNPIFGVTTNPYDKKRSSGGSSGGEGAILAFRGAPLGLGGDMGGSVRIPAHWCGVNALKPSVGRLMGVQGIRVAETGLAALRGTLGPMAPDVDSLIWFMRSVCSKQSSMYQMDPYALPMPFDEQLFEGDGRPLTIGYYDHDNWLTAAPACQRSVAVAKRILESKGHNLIRVKFPFDKEEMRRVMSCYVAFFFADGGRQTGTFFENGITDPYHSHLAKFCSWPIWYKKIRAFFTVSPYWRTAYAACIADTSSFREKVAEMDRIKAKYVEFWNRNQLDCLICPVLATPSLPYELPPQLFCVLWSYCAVYNLLDFAAGVVKCVNVTAADEKAAFEANDPRQQGLKDNDWVPKLLKECQKGSTHLPVGVQVVAQPFREEMCLRVMKEIENGVRESDQKS